MSLTRGASQDLISEFSKQGWHPSVLLYLDWPTGPVRVHSGVGPISYGGFDWSGIGHYGRVSVPAESKSAAARRMVLTLFADRDSILTEAMRNARSRAAELYFGAVTSRAGNVLASDPALMFRGGVDGQTFELVVTDDRGFEKVEAALQLTVVSGPPLRRNAALYHTQEDHNSNYSATDTAGRLIQSAEINSTVMTWPE